MEMVDLNLNSADPGSASYDGPGSTNDRTVDIGSNDPLVNLGLVDARTGQALPTDDWRPVPLNGNSQPQSQPAQPGQMAPTGQPAPSTGQSDPASQYQLVAATLQAQAAQAWAEAVGSGANPDVAKQVIGAKLEAELVKARTSLREQAAEPMVRQQVATMIAGKLGMGLVNPQELLAYDSPRAMEQAASQLATARRAGNYQQRIVSGTDRSEGTAPARGIAPAIAGLSPEKKIELGIRRGQYS